MAGAAGTSHPTISRLELALIRHPPIELLAAVCAVVGLDLVLKAYPAGDALRDLAHVQLLTRLQRELHPTLRFRTEQPVGFTADLRAWDATIAGSGWLCHVEAETAVTDAQALTRRLELKMRDGGRGRVVLLISETRRNARALRPLRPLLADALPLDTRAILHALRRAADPGGNGIVIL